jgi:hypothetical protein
MQGLHTGSFVSGSDAHERPEIIGANTIASQNLARIETTWSAR